MGGLCAEYLQSRGITEGTIKKHGLEFGPVGSDFAKGRLGRGWGKHAKAVNEVLWIPLFDQAGATIDWIARPLPTIEGLGKFICSLGSAGAPYIPHSVYSILAGQALILTEGPIKALACVQASYNAIGLNGVWCVALPSNNGEEALLLRPDLEKFCAKRSVYLAFDADQWTNKKVRHALIRAALLLIRAGATVYQLDWPANEGKGIDDYLASSSIEDSVLVEGLIRGAKGLLGSLTSADADLIRGELELIKFERVQRRKVLDELPAAVKDEVLGPSAARELGEALNAFSWNQAFFLLIDQEYEKLSISELRRYLHEERKIKKKNIDSALVVIERKKRVDWAGELSGYSPGVINFGDRKLLCTRGPSLIAEAEGDWGLLEGILIGMLGHIPRQVDLLYGWLATTLKTIESGFLAPGQALVLVGPQHCGKSFFQECVLTPLLGGRVAEPFQFMTGGTGFNAELFAAEHLMINDQVPQRDEATRRQVGQMIKTFSSNKSWRCHAKGLTGLQLPFFSRLSISCNDDDHALMVLPPIDQDLFNKVILLSVERGYLFEKNDSDRLGLAKQVWNLLPAFSYFLKQQYRLPAELSDDRYGVKGYQDPAILRKLTTLGADAQLLELAREAVRNRSVPLSFPHELTSYEWFELIFENEKLREGLRKITSSPDGLGRIFTRLVESGTQGMRKRILHGRWQYEIEESK